LLTYFINGTFPAGNFPEISGNFPAFYFPGKVTTLAETFEAAKIASVYTIIDTKAINASLTQN